MRTSKEMELLIGMIQSKKVEITSLPMDVLETLEEYLQKIISDLEIEYERLVLENEYLSECKATADSELF